MYIRTYIHIIMYVYVCMYAIPSHHVLASARLASSLSLDSVSLANEVRVRIPRMVAVSFSTCSEMMASKQLWRDREEDTCDMHM